MSRSIIHLLCLPFWVEDNFIENFRGKSSLCNITCKTLHPNDGEEIVDTQQGEDESEQSRDDADETKTKNNNNNSLFKFNFNWRSSIQSMPHIHL